MLNDVKWRKMPIDILTNETMTYIESKMPEGYAFAPFMFYQAAMKKADDDGIFDIGDGIIFARLMRVDNTSIVFKIANLMAKMKVIYHVSPESNYCMLADWEYSRNSQPRTLQQRRQIVQNKIIEAEKHKALEEQCSDFSEEISSDSFSVPFDDKIEENVVKNSHDDKIKENVVMKNSTEREKEREIRKIDTHTQERERETEGAEETETERQTEAKTSAGLSRSPAPVSAEKKALAQKNKKTAEKQKEVEVVPVFESSNEKPAEDNSEKTGNERKTGDFATVSAMFDQFFTENSFGYQVAKGRNKVNELVDRVLSLVNKDFNASVIADTFCKEFKAMHDSEGQWKDLPLTPSMMLNNAVWEHLLSYCGKALAKKKKKKNPFIEQAELAKREVEAERDSVIQEMDAEAAKYGIALDDPHKTMKVILARQAEKTVSESPPAYEEDIF